jgi:ATP-dependent Clp protease ATP-binding subunit ClpA
LRAAEQECRNHNHYYVGVEHVLLALVEEHDETIDGRLAALGIKPSEVQAEVRRRLGTGEDRLWEGILITPRFRNVVLLAEHAAGPDGAVEPVHLFDAICDEGRSAVAEIIRPKRNAGRSRGVAG